jgi:hypothetical protein
LEEALPPPVACELVRIAPQIAGKVREIPLVAPLPGASARQALLEAAQQFFTGIAARDAPLLLFLDDLHWADDGSLALLHLLARRSRSQRLLILGTYRDVELHTRQPHGDTWPLEQTLAAMNRERLYEDLSLRRLPEAGVAEMVTAILSESSPPAAFVSALYHETEGNPFFVEEVLKHLVEEGAIYREAGRWQIQPPAGFSVPQSIKVTIGRRLERLSEESRDLLRLAGVIGQQFRFEVLLQASGLEEERLLGIVEEWLGAHLVVEERRGWDELYRFQHAQIRGVLYDQPSLRRKARLHERVGLALEAVYAGAVGEHLDELAHHFARARSEAGIEKGIDYCLRAGEKARNLYANEEAIQHLTAALELLRLSRALPEDEPHLRQRWGVVFHLAKAYMGSRAFDRAKAVLQDYLSLAQRAGCPWGMAAGHCEMAAALTESQRATSVVDSDSSRQLRRENLERSLQIADEYGLIEWHARARADLAFLLSTEGDDLPRAEELLRETLHSPDGIPQEHIQQTYATLMQVCALQGKWNEVAAALRQSIPFGVPNSSLPINCLATMEAALERAGKQAEFMAFCNEAQALYAQAGLPLTLNSVVSAAGEAVRAVPRAAVPGRFRRAGAASRVAVA